MKKVTLSLTLIGIMSLQADSLSKALSETKVDGYLRGTYQSHNVKNDKTYKDDALGGKVHFQTGNYYGLSAGASIYSSNAIFHDDNRGLVPLRGENHKSYTILGEAYLKANFGKSMLKIGRHFAQVDDIGMVPNSFEALIFENKDIENTTIFLGQVQRMAGVDADVVDDFTNINGSKNMQVAGITYEGIKDVDVSAWYYRLKDAPIDSIAYLEANYEKEIGDTTFGMGVQYAKESYLREKDAKVYGGTLSATANKLGLTLATAYTKSKDNVATSGFGGGPFFSNSEYLIIDNAGADGKALWYGAEYDASKMGIDGLTIGLEKVTQTTATGTKATEFDIVASYDVNEEVEIHGIFSNLKGANVGEDEAKHLRVFANYNF
ncbi:hypothetical protein MNB_SV-14-1514 [hydrothermal vent metagenome]|uniref:Outer membrane porin, OprD family n=1 Tax=hydrothermal vent metagenome TaxID=652676 RepID=A0A1W1CEB1_9ZZZZ